MKKSLHTVLTTHFSSKRSALVLGTGLLASLSFAGFTFAQGLNIPTDLKNAAITIQQILLSPSGTATTPQSGVNITLDGSNGDLTL